MNTMDISDPSRDMLGNVTMTEVAPQYMMQRVTVEPSLLNTELLPVHNGLVVDMSNTEYLPAVNYGTDLLGHDLTEEDRNLAEALVAVQLVHQQKHQQLQQDSNVIVSTSTLSPLVSAAHLDNGKELTDQLVLPVDRPMLTNINNAFINAVDERHLRHTQLPILKKYDEVVIAVQSAHVKKEYISVKSEYESLDDDLHIQRDSDCENKNDARSSKKSLPHKKRISRKLKKNCTVSRKGYKCDVCEKIFSSVEELSSHSDCQSAKGHTFPFCCQICNGGYDDQLIFFEHLKTHYEPAQTEIKEGDPEPYKTEVAKNTFLSSLLPPLNCLQCSKTFRRQKAFEAHMRDVHANKIEDEFSEPEDLMEGIRDVVEANDQDSTEEIITESKVWYHPDMLQSTEADIQSLEVEAQICNLCGQVFNNNEEMIQHMENCKASSEPGEEEKVPTNDFKSRNRKKRRKSGHLFCPHCDRVFSHRNSLMYHMRGHTGERPHQCDICGKSFFAASALKVHMRLHSGDKPYKCEFCGRHFRQWGDLKYHCISIHSDQKQYQCEYCGKDFARKYSLIVHRRIHTGEKNYRCEFCGKTFRASSYLQNHRRIHTGEKPHPCEVCGKPFRVRSDMKRHLNTHSRRRTGRPTTITASSSVIEAHDTDNVETIVPDDDQMLENQDVSLNNEEQVSDVGVQYDRDPLETVREGTNTLFTNGHQLFICYPSEISVRSTMETQWIQTQTDN